MRKLLEKIYHKLEAYLWDDKTRWELECEIYDLQVEVSRLNDAIDYFKDVIDRNETLRRY